MTPQEASALVFRTFGEHTSIPIKIREAVISISDLPADFLTKSIALVKLSIANETVKKNISSTLRLTLPVGASVKRFELLRGGKWIPATAVPKKRSKEIVYREKEKGRDVAAVSNVGSRSNVFEIELSPLPYRVEVKLRLELLMESTQTEPFARHFLARDSSTLVTIEKAETHRDSTHIIVPECKNMDGGLAGGAVVGKCFGQTHFVCKVPSLSKFGKAGEASSQKSPIQRMAVVCDTSSSMSASKNMIQTRCSRLWELFEACQREGRGTQVIELFSFGMGDPKLVGIYSSQMAFSRAMESIEYDGGTNVATLPKLISELQTRDEENKVDCVIVFSDGMDNLGRTPTIKNSYELDFPVHCVADFDGEINVTCLRSIASVSPRFPGVVFTKKDTSYVHGVLVPLPVLRSIKTDQNEEAFMEEIDDGFRCVPDHRLRTLNQPIGNDGLLVTGVLKHAGAKEPSSVTKLIAEVSFGGEMLEFHFGLWKDQGACDGNCSDERESTINGFPTVYIEDSSSSSEFAASDADSSRILGHLYAEQMYDEAETFGLKSGTNVEGICEELAIKYGFCSSESSLLMLYEADQFIEHDVLPPEGHPVREHESIVAFSTKRAEDGQTSTGAKLGQIGGPKTEDQKMKVTKLARKLKAYFQTGLVAPPAGPPHPHQAASAYGTLGGGSALFPPPPAAPGRYIAAPPPAPRPPRPALAPPLQLQTPSTAPPVPPQRSATLPHRYTQGYPTAPPPPTAAAAAAPPPPPPPPAAAPTLLAVLPPPLPTQTPSTAHPVSAQQSATLPQYYQQGYPTPPPPPPPPPLAVAPFLPARAPTVTSPIFSGQCAATYGACPPPPPPLAVPVRAQTPNFPPMMHAMGSMGAVVATPREMSVQYSAPTLCSYAPAPSMAFAAFSSAFGFTTAASAPPNAAPAPAPTQEPVMSPTRSPPNGSSKLQQSLDQQSYIQRLEKVLQDSPSRWQHVYREEMESLGGFDSVSPSFFLNTARVLVGNKRGIEAARVACNCLESGIDDVQMLRSVGYALLSTELAEGIDLAIEVFDKVIDLEPCEPQSYLDAALSRFWECRKRVENCKRPHGSIASDLVDHVTSAVRRCQELLTRVLTHHWASRFDEVEWPALVLLHYLSDFVSKMNTPFSRRRMEQWPKSLLVDAFPSAGHNGDSLRCNHFNPALCVWLGWDTDKTDVDLHVTEPSGEVVCYRNQRGKTGSLLSRDFTKGYGPEVYLVKDLTSTQTATGHRIDGEYKVEANYFASHQDSRLTGATSAVVWTMERKRGSLTGHDMKFRFVRLDTHKQKTHVATAEIEGSKKIVRG